MVSAHAIMHNMRKQSAKMVKIRIKAKQLAKKAKQDTHTKVKKARVSINEGEKASKKRTVRKVKPSSQAFLLSPCQKPSGSSGLASSSHN